MKHSTRWNRDFRPRTYWLQSADEYLKHRPKGTVRRRMLESADSLGSVPDWLSEQSLSDQDRYYWSGRHPMMMGGEYLPDLGDGEVEIARIEMQSVTGDVISLRAGRDAGGVIRYRFCDEYADVYSGEEARFEFAPAASEEPLTFGEVADLLDSATRPGLSDEYPEVIWGTLEFNRVSGLDDHQQLVTFIRVVSPFYPGLTEYFEWRSRQWLAGLLRAERAAERERRRRLRPFEREIDAIVQREESKRDWSRQYGGIGRGIFCRDLRSRLEKSALEHGELTRVLSGG